MAADTVNILSGMHVQVPEFALPIGISFYTFQTLSYTIDVYRGETGVQHSYWKFLLFVSLFHQLVAGPIVRYRDIEKQIEHRKFRLEMFSSGITRFAVGLAKKVLIANAAGRLSAPFLDGNLDSLSILGAWWGILLFGFQIYFDFSGYSDMAIGLGRMFGFSYKENFRYPYSSRSVSDFWRRWHISLGSFFRDYLYIPLGGGRKRMFLSLMTVWFLTGLWHGASWNFVLWGVYYGILIYAEKKISPILPFRFPRVVKHLYVILITLAGWALFYFTDLTRMGSFISVMFGLSRAELFSSRLELSMLNNVFFVITAAAASLPVVPRLKKALRIQRAGFLRAGVPLVNGILVVLSTVMLVGSGYNPFLYFRF
jgi:alginate O-acetyltransferase complex protein AlgI